MSKALANHEEGMRDFAMRGIVFAAFCFGGHQKLL